MNVDFSLQNVVLQQGDLIFFTTFITNFNNYIMKRFIHFHLKSMIKIIAIFVLLNACNMNQEKKQKGGIIFFQTQQLEILNHFYINKVGCELWLDQGGCQIYKHGNMLFGFCQRESTDMDGMITFFYTDKKKVDEMYEKFKDIAEAEPKDNPKYLIYHFFTKDPDGRAIEFQYFNNEISDFNSQACYFISPLALLSVLAEKNFIISEDADDSFFVSALSSK